MSGGRLTWWVALSFSFADKTVRDDGGELDRIPSGSIFPGESMEVWTSPGILSSSDPNGIYPVQRQPSLLPKNSARFFRKVFQINILISSMIFPRKIPSGFSSFSPWGFSVVFWRGLQRLASPPSLSGNTYGDVNREGRHGIPMGSIP